MEFAGARLQGLARGASPLRGGLYAGSLGFEPCPLRQQLTLERRQQIAQAFYMLAILIERGIEFGIGSFGRKGFSPQSRAGAQQFG